ncbi:unnamed protein product [Mytilus coruscus]|uniref:Caspase family p20 domain-containing protein n=1 Tax=Mytilus coruscus TaxID=42192 RepID=A0A6J8BIM6_MYTCO|nr:unnamed protein product [Mytilus coruscus]
MNVSMVFVKNKIVPIAFVKTDIVPMIFDMVHKKHCLMITVPIFVKTVPANDASYCICQNTAYNDGSNGICQNTAYNDGSNEICQNTAYNDGYCLLITNSEFYQVPGCPISKKLPNRPGVEGDAKRLEGLMSTIGYKVIRKDNLKKWEIEREMKAMADADQKKFDCFVCIISSHGTANKVYGSDGYDVILGPQLKRFNVDACPDLQGKPKIFLFQACNTETEDKMQKTLQPLINETDFLYGFSTLPGHLAYNPKDGEKTGSYYLYSLYKHLSDKYKA